MNNSDIEKMMPKNIRAEQNVLGSMMLDSQALSLAMDLIVNQDYFYVPCHKTVYKAIIELAEKGQIADETSVYTALENKGLIGDLIDFTFLGDLTGTVLSTSYVETHCNSLIESFQRRELIRLSNEIIKEAYDTSNNLNEVIDNAEKNILSVSEKRNAKGLVHAKDIVKERFERYQERYETGIPDTENDNVVLTHISAIDDILKIKKSNLVIIAARPGMGKSALMLNILSNMALKGKKLPVVVFSLEMSKEEVIDRMLSSEAEVNSYYLEAGKITNQQYENLLNSYQQIYNSKIFVDDFEESNIQLMKSKARKIKQTYGELGAIFVDYIQLMDSDNKNDNRVNELSKITRGLKKMARALGCPVIALSQLSRDVEKRQDKRPQLSDLRDSGSLEQDADSVLFIYRDEYYNSESTKKKTAEVSIAKQRHGPCKKVELFFSADVTKFSSLELFV